MNTALAIALGVAIGALGAAGHLVVTYRRARSVRARGTALTLATFPLGLLAPIAAFFVALQLSPGAAWGAFVGLVLTHRVVLWRVKRAV